MEILHQVLQQLETIYREIHDSIHSLDLVFIIALLIFLIVRAITAKRTYKRQLVSQLFMAFVYYYSCLGLLTTVGIWIFKQIQSSNVVWLKKLFIISPKIAVFGFMIYWILFTFRRLIGIDLNNIFIYPYANIHDLIEEVNFTHYERRYKDGDLFDLKGRVKLKNDHDPRQLYIALYFKPFGSPIFSQVLSNPNLPTKLIRGQFTFTSLNESIFKGLDEGNELYLVIASEEGKRLLNGLRKDQLKFFLPKNLVSFPDINFLNMGYYVEKITLDKVTLRYHQTNNKVPLKTTYI